MPLKQSYTLLAPFYDPLIAAVTSEQRKISLAGLKAFDLSNTRVLLTGIGTGLDIPYLPPGPHYIGIDLTPAMLKRAQFRANKHQHSIELTQGDAMALAFPDKHFDVVILHLILAVVPNPGKALQEAHRVVKPGGHIFIFDKFLKPGERALVRRLLSPIIARIATRTDVVFETTLSHCPGLKVVADEPTLFGGWFRRIQLTRTAPTNAPSAER